MIDINMFQLGSMGLVAFFGWEHVMIKNFVSNLLDFFGQLRKPTKEFGPIARKYLDGLQEGLVDGHSIMMDILMMKC